MDQHNLNEESPLVITTSASGTTLTLVVPGYTLADYDWVRDDIKVGDSSVDIYVPDSGTYVMEVVTEGESSAWARDTSGSPHKCVRNVALAVGASTSLAVTIRGTDSATGARTAMRRQIIIIKRKAD